MEEEKVVPIPTYVDSEGFTVMHNLQLRSNAGWYLGSLYLDEEIGTDAYLPYSRESDYYKTRALLAAAYPDSIHY